MSVRRSSPPEPDSEIGSAAPTSRESRPIPRIEQLTFHHLALLAAGVLSLGFLAVLYHVVDVVGGVTVFLGLVAGSIGLAAAFRRVSPRVALLVGVVLLGAGLGYYLITMPPAQFAQLSFERVTSDLIAMATGYSVLRLTNVQQWALAVTPAPTFLTWYFAFRRNYARSAVVGGAAVGFFVLTSDSTLLWSLLGVVGAFGAVGFGTLDVHRANWTHGEFVVGTFALLLVAAGSVPAASTGSGPILPAGTTSTSGDLVNAGPQVSVGGSIDLSPQVLFTVNASRPAYWRGRVYDRFTGSTWIRTGLQSSVGHRAPGPPGPRVENEQRITSRRELNVVPAAAKPVRVGGAGVSITEYGDLAAPNGLAANQSYSVVSERPVATTAARSRTDGAYPAGIGDRYRRVPASTTDRVRRLAENIAGEEASPYRKAQAIESWLEANKQYSLDVPNPDGQVVDTFLFERDGGYCVYYASAMVVMLRTQGVPARFVVGYTTGQQVDNDTWVVRGYDSHAWVEVYVRDVGWVTFDPTPAGPRRAVEQEQLQSARASGQPGVDALGSENQSDSGSSTDAADATNSTGTVGDGAAARRRLFPNETRGFGEMTTGLDGAMSPLDRNGGGPRLPPPSTLGLGAAVVLSIGIGASRTRVLERIYRFAWLRRLPEGDPDTVIEGVLERVEYLLARERRPRRAGETIREYVADVSTDERVAEIVRLHERSRYAADRDPNAAERAKDSFRALVADTDAGSRFSPSTVFNRLLS